MIFMINDLSDYAQIKAGNFTKNIKLFNIRDAVSSVVSMLEQKAKELKLSINVNFENISDKHELDSQFGFFSPFIRTDDNRVKQVLLGLLANSLKFTQEGGVTINVKVITQKLLYCEGYKYQAKIQSYKINCSIYLKRIVGESNWGSLLLEATTLPMCHNQRPR